MFDKNIRQLIRRGIYIIVLLALGMFLFQLGPGPWFLAVQHWNTLIMIIVATGAGIVVQAASFRKSYPADKVPLPLNEISRIWAASAIISVVAPIFAGLATRTTMLINAGTPLLTCILSSSRQLWMGLEYASLLGGIATALIDFPHAKLVSASLLLLWGGMIVVRLLVATRMDIEDSLNKTSRFIISLRSNYPPSAHFWFILQLGLMSAVYYIAFQGLGANLNFLEALALSSVTVFISIIAFVPNGLGLTDAMWVVVAMRTGVTLETSVSLAILIRVAHLISALIIYLVLRFVWEGRFNSVE